MADKIKQKKFMDGYREAAKVNKKFYGREIDIAQMDFEFSPCQTTGMTYANNLYHAIVAFKTSVNAALSVAGVDHLSIDWDRAAIIATTRDMYHKMTRADKLFAWFNAKAKEIKSKI